MLIKITLNLENKDFFVEHGEVYYRDLTKEEQKELKVLESQLENFKDFTSAEKLKDDQRQAVMNKKKRVMELQQLPTAPQIEWKAVDLESLLLMKAPGKNTSPEYVENLPQFLWDKILKNEVNVKVESAPHPATHFMYPEAQEDFEQPVKTPLATNRVEAKLYEIRDKLSTDWPDLVTVEIKNNTYWVSGKKWLDADYGPIDDAMKDLGGKWISKGKGDKEAHWEIPR